jgi:hypothetical protein
VKEMNKYLKIVGFGFLIWLIPFLVSFLIFSLREENRPLFESIMPVVLTIVVLIFSILYFVKLDNDFIGQGILIGVVWIVINIIIDLVMFLPESEWQMSFTDYMMDIGLTYLIILLIPIGIGILLEKRK